MLKLKWKKPNIAKITHFERNIKAICIGFARPTKLSGEYTFSQFEMFLNKSQNKTPILNHFYQLFCGPPPHLWSNMIFSVRTYVLNTKKVVLLRLISINMLIVSFFV